MCVRLSRGKFLDVTYLRNFLNLKQVRDGHDANSTLVGTYCEEVPPLIVSSYNYLWLKFESDSNNNGRGFKANYTTSNLGK
mgnify:CR=1 FL=1